MKDIDFTYRSAIFTALNGAITYNANVIKVFSGYAETTDNLYIVIGDSSVNSNNNKHKFGNTATITIEVVHHLTRGVTYKEVDDVYNLMMEILIPAPHTAGFSLTGFQALNVTAESNHFLEQTLDKVLRKIVRVQSLIIENQIY